jgi:hypothetical protein
MTRYLKANFIRSVIYPSFGVALLSESARDAIRNPDAINGEQFIVAGADGIIWGLPFAFALIWASGLAVTRMLNERRWALFFVASIALVLLSGLLLGGVTGYYMHIRQMWGGLFYLHNIPSMILNGCLGGVIASIPTFAVWAIAESLLARKTRAASCAE